MRSSRLMKWWNLEKVLIATQYQLKTRGYSQFSRYLNYSLTFIKTCDLVILYWPSNMRYMSEKKLTRRQAVNMTTDIGEILRSHKKGPKTPEQLQCTLASFLQVSLSLIIMIIKWLLSHVDLLPVWWELCALPLPLPAISCNICL